ncbi:MAG: sigma 54-interacting transcriptional regulator [Thermoanaerobacteraceae bacterium]|nr:sigma 54-interacting transcriptional regulator [Thermoanaerobacteraceae bacterium]
MSRTVRDIDLKNVLDSVYNGIVVCDTQGRIILFNRAASHWTKVPVEKALGERVDKIIPNSGLLEVLKTQERMRTQKIIINNKLLITNRSPIYDAGGNLIGAVGVFDDISEYEKVTRQLRSVRQMKKELDSFIESSYDGIWITDGEGYTLHINSAYERITGIRREEVVGRPIQELVDKGYFSDSVTLHVLTRKERVTIMQDIYRTGKRVLITGNPIFDDEGNINRVVINVRDITELLSLKEQLEAKDKLTTRYKNELAHLRSQQTKLDNVVIKSAPMRHVFDIAVRVGKVDTTVLILGESGVGKELVAQAIVAASDRAKEPFIKVNCGAIPENLMESELFGYEKGAFTGADRKGKMGLFELAHKGTIFLDEVAEIPLNLQAKLLRVIQEQEIMRVGGTKPVKLDVRIIAATNWNLEEMVKKGKFREDLFYRLHVVPITVPPLRERPDDIPALVNHFLQRFNEKYQMNKAISPEILDILMAYHWPGNVRELQNLIERLVVLTQDRVITPEHLPVQFRRGEETLKPYIEIKGIIPLKEAVRRVEEELLTRAMKKYGTTRRAAVALGVDQSTIVRKMQKLNINVQEEKG